MLCWKGNSWTSGNCTLRDGKEAKVRLLGYEMVGLCCVGRGTAHVCTLRDEKEPMVFWAKRWSVHAAWEEEQLVE
jgi:hypothetical protein